MARLRETDQAVIVRHEIAVPEASSCFRKQMNTFDKRDLILMKIESNSAVIN